MSKAERIAEAYWMMAELGYRPAAPSDGFGNITVPYDQLDLNKEAREYAAKFIKEEDENRYWAGCTDYTFNRAAVLALEAFRLMNEGEPGNPKLVPAMLQKASEEYQRALREDRHR